MRNDGERRWHGTGAVHCPPRILRFFSSKTKGHVSSLSVDQLLKTKVEIRAIPSVQRHRREKEYLLTEISSGNGYGDRPARRRKLETRKVDTAHIDLLATHVRSGLIVEANGVQNPSDFALTSLTSSEEVYLQQMSASRAKVLFRAIHHSQSKTTGTSKTFIIPAEKCTCPGNYYSSLRSFIGF
jgi:hypothetical protein